MLFEVMVIAATESSVAVILIDPPVFVMFISSVADPTASISMPPADAKIAIADDELSEDVS